MKVLFITRKYPPQVGGMEKYSYELIRHFPGNKKVIALRKSQKHLIWFLPYALIKGLFLSRKVDLVYLCDGLLAPIGFIIKKIAKKPVLSTVHGLDVTYPNWLYQNISVRALKRLDKIIAVSNSTIEECCKRDFNYQKCIFIPNGIEIKNNSQNFTKQDLAEFLDFNINGKKILLSVGRLVKRKGHLWFIKNVLPKLDSNVIYLIVGEGPEKNIIQTALINMNLSNRVFLLGKIPDDKLELVYSTADLFIMPNIKVKGDMEGFGIVALEAAIHGLPVIASRIEGIKDAIIDDKNGFLVEPCNVSQFVNKINRLVEEYDIRTKIGRQFRKFTIKNYNWNKIISRYLAEFNNFVSKKS